MISVLSIDQPTQLMGVRIAIDLEIFATLAQKNSPATLAELAAVKNADPFLAGRTSFLFYVDCTLKKC